MKICFSLQFSWGRHIAWSNKLKWDWKIHVPFSAFIALFILLQEHYLRVFNILKAIVKDNLSRETKDDQNNNILFYKT